jgi:glycosyltransferase involved in cell wall biosynthesis
MTEALACGLPVIMNHGLVTEEMKLYLRSEALLPFIELDSVDFIAARNAIAHLANCPEGQRKQLGELGRCFVEEHFNIDKTSITAYKILEDITKAMSFFFLQGILY